MHSANHECCGAGSRCRCVGFTLVEVLVAMMIMVIIILMLSSVFHQMTTSWDVGTRKTHINMQGRAVMDFMAQELSQAVADDVVPCAIQSGNADITFFTLNSVSNRALTRVRYYLTGNKIRRTIRRIKVDQPYTPNPSLENGDAGTLLTGVETLEFQTPEAAYTTNLPPWINIVLELRQDERVASVGGRSAGRDGQLGTADDITLE